MKRAIIILTFVMLSSMGFTQNVSGYGKIFKRKTISDRKPIPYQSVREADVIWAKLLWREVNLREKINLPLYFPEKPMDGRYSLIDLLLKGIQEQTIMAFDTDGDEFKVPITLDEIKTRLGAGVDSLDLVQEDGSMKRVANVSSIRPYEVKRYIVKELWYFDKQSSTMQVRIIGLCPVREYYKKNDPEMKQMLVFWVNYDECRDLLVSNEVFNAGNDAMRLSFDDLFQKRRFNSIIKKESNVYNNRPINSYADGLDAMIESDRIREEMFNWEQDLWQY